MPAQLISILDYIVFGLIVLVVIDVIISNIQAMGRGVSSYSPVVRFVRAIVNPMLEPFRRLLPPSRTGGWDFSPVFVMLLLSLVRSMINRLH